MQVWLVQFEFECSVFVHNNCIQNSTNLTNDKQTSVKNVTNIANKMSIPKGEASLRGISALETESGLEDAFCEKPEKCQCKIVPLDHAF